MPHEVQVEDASNYLRPDMSATWGHPNVAASYRHRPHYPPQTFEILAGLIQDVPRAVLDLGCGTGFVARPLASLADRLDAVDASAAMIDEGRRLPGGNHPTLNWIVGRAETVPLQPPYALVTAGDSLHWMDWTVVLPRLAEVLTPNGSFAILDVNGKVAVEDDALRDGTRELVQRYSTYSRPGLNLVAELQRRGFFAELGRAETEPIAVDQPVDGYVESFHAHSAQSWARMHPDDVAAFDSALKRLVLDRVGSTVPLQVRGLVIWGKPLRP